MKRARHGARAMDRAWRMRVGSSRLRHGNEGHPTVTVLRLRPDGQLPNPCPMDPMSIS